jgi:hypothetical protein
MEEKLKVPAVLIKVVQCESWYSCNQKSDLSTAVAGSAGGKWKFSFAKEELASI